MQNKPPPVMEVRAEEVDAHTWYTLRVGKLEAVTLSDRSVRFRVRIADAGRDPFITQWFNDIAPAQDFLERVKEENTSFIRKHLEEEKARGNEPQVG